MNGNLLNVVNSHFPDDTPNRDNYRRGKTNGYVGYSVKDVQVMTKKAEEYYSPFHRAAIELFGYSGPRMDEFRSIKWRHLDFENNRI
jgi:integrase